MIRRILPFALLALLAVPAMVQAQSNPYVPAAETQRMLTRALADLELLEDWVDRRCAASGCHLERNRIDRVRAALLMTQQSALVAPAYGPSVYGVPAQPMSDGAFRDFFNRVKDEYYTKSKMELLKHQARYSLFTAKQVRELMDDFFYSSSKLDALEVLAPRMVDPDQSLVIYDAFFYSHSKAKARQIIEKAIPMGIAGVWY